MQTDLYRTYAAFELYLDFHYILHTYLQSDFENLVIYACVAEATLRPHVHGREVGAAQENAPELASGSISRLLVADRTGLPRETVRRKIGAMVSAGLLVPVARGSVATTPRPFNDPLKQFVASVARFQDRLRKADLLDGHASQATGGGLFIDGARAADQDENTKKDGSE